MLDTPHSERRGSSRCLPPSRIAHIMPSVVLAYSCALILVASIIGGMIPVWFQLTHRWMQFAVSFVAGVMLGIGVLHMLPHALMDATAAAEAAPALPAVAGSIATQLSAS